MRFRNFATVGLVLAFLVTPVSALVCEWRCAPAKASPPASVGSAAEDCHGTASETDSAGPALTNAVHDCADHADLTLLASPKAESSRSSPRAASIALSAADFAIVAVMASSGATGMLHDLAPPGAVRLIAPLRI